MARRIVWLLAPYHLGKIATGLAVVGVLGLAGVAPQAQEQAEGLSDVEAELKMTVVSSGSTESESEEFREPAPMRVSMEFQDANLKDVLKTFSQQTGINLIASEEVGDRTVTLYLEDVTVMDALDQLLRAANLTYERPAESQIYLVKPKPVEKEPEVVTVTKVYRLKFARVSTSRLARAIEALSAITPFEAMQLSAVISGGGGGVGGAAGGGGAVGGGAGQEIGIDKVVEELLTEEGEVVVDERTNSLVVTDVPDNFPRIEATLNALDIKTAQILIETEVLETTLSKLKDLGIEWGTGSEGTLFQLTPAKRTTRMPFSTLFGKEGSQPIASGTAGLTLGTLDTSQAVAALQALERDTETRVLARPKVLTLDNETAVIRLTTLQAIGFQTTTGQQTATTTATPERTTTGIILVVTPQVNEDNFVTMLVEPSVTKVVTAAIQPPTAVGGTVVDPKSRSARALVRIRQGDTLVLGGLIDRSEQETLQRVPILSGIPIIGEAFKNKEVNDSASELIVFVTPRILGEPVGPQVAAAGQAPFPIREQERTPSRQELIEETLNRLERPRL